MPLSSWWQNLPPRLYYVPCTSLCFPTKGGIPRVENPQLNSALGRENFNVGLLFAECESLEAIAQFDFHARSDRELSFKKGDNLQLYTQVSNDWWRGRGAQGSEGLIPDKYILLKMK